MSRKRHVIPRLAQRAEGPQCCNPATGNITRKPTECAGRFAEAIKRLRGPSARFASLAMTRYTFYFAGAFSRKYSRSGKSSR